MLSLKKTGYEISEVGISTITFHVINHLNRNISYIHQFFNSRERWDGEISVLLDWVCLTHWVRISRGRNVHVAQKENQISSNAPLEVMKRKARKQVRSTNSAHMLARVFSQEQCLQTHTMPKKSIFSLMTATFRHRKIFCRR